jgi:ketosteroid isomerase-like protein
MLNLLPVVTLLIGLAGAPALFFQTTTPVDQARALFTRFVEMEQAYDVAIADLYADDAVIKNKRTYPTGEVRELTIPPAQYKQLIRQAMPLAKSRGDRSTYSKCGYKAEGANVRITCSRYSELKKYTSPYTLLVGPNRAGEWRILEELSESRP